MNQIGATLKGIENIQNLHLLTFETASVKLEMLGLELDPTLDIGKRVALGVKPTSVTLSREFCKNLSHTNQMRMKIIDIQTGELLSSLKLLADLNEIEAIIISKNLHKMNLNVGESIFAIINPSDLFITEIVA